VTTKNNNEAVFYLDKDDRHLNVQIETAEQHIIQSIRRCDDITLVTSLNRETRSKSVENILKNYKSEIRTFTLGSEFFNNDDDGDSASITDLIDMTEVILGSTHSEKFFVVLIEDADGLQTSDLEELSSVIQTLNQENNHAGILMVCDPTFVKTVKEASGISALKVSECSLDKISQEDIQNFIDERQKDIEPSKKLVFDSFALKTITMHATGSLYEASILLEWCRVYAQHKNVLQLNSELINQMFSALLKASPQSGTNLITDYPPADFNFDDKSSDEQLKPFIVRTDKPDNTPDKGSEPAAVISEPENKTVADTVIPDSQDIPTLKTEKHPAAAAAAPAIDKEGDGADQASPQMSDIDEAKPGKKGFGWILLIVLLALGLYYFVLSPEQTTPPVDTDSEADPSVTPVPPMEDSQQETFEEIAIPEQAPIVAANPKDETPQITPLQVENNDVLNDTYDEQQEAIQPEQPPVTEETLTETEEQIDSPEMDGSQAIQPAPVNSDLPIEEPISAGPVPDEPQYEDTASGELGPEDSSTEVSQPGEIPPASATQTNKGEQAIGVLLEIADQQFNDKRLTTPESNNAFSTYQLILEIDPENQQAAEGLVRIVDRYKEWINTDIENKNYTRARIFLRRALRVDPDDPELKRLWVIVDRNS
jgi:hypothetical protein